MASFSLHAMTAALGAATLASAHGFVRDPIVNGLIYKGYNPNIPGTPLAGTVGWITVGVEDQGFVNVANYTSPDIICHRSASSVQGHIPLAGGDKIHIGWSGWPQNHHGAILTYIAHCGNRADGCATVDKSTLRWFKIDNGAPGLIRTTGTAHNSTALVSQSEWVTDIMNGNVGQYGTPWQVQIPPKLKPGAYVLRHELIALHYAYTVDTAPYPNMKGAQNYPQCLNLFVKPSTGATSTLLTLTSASGTPAQSLYKATDPGISYNIYPTGSTLPPYTIPGPTVISGAVAVPWSSQTPSAVVGTGTAVKVTSTTGTSALPTA